MNTLIYELLFFDKELLFFTQKKNRQTLIPLQEHRTRSNEQTLYGIVYT